MTERRIIASFEHLSDEPPLRFQSYAMILLDLPLNIYHPEHADVAGWFEVPRIGDTECH